MVQPEGDKRPVPPARPVLGGQPVGDDVTAKRKHRSLGEQLNRSPMVLHASWLVGLSVLAAGVGSINPAGLAFLVILFLPIMIAFRRDRLSFPIIFATLFLPTWPWAMFKAVARTRVLV